MRDVYWRAEALIGLAPHFSEAILDDGLEVARSCGYRRAWAVAKFAAGVPDAIRRRVIEEAWSAARAVKDHRERETVLTDLAWHLPEAMAEAALTDARAIEDAADRACALAGLALRLLAPSRGEVRKEALALARSVAGQRSRADALARVVPGLDPQDGARIAREALAVAREGHSVPAELVVALLPVLTEAERDCELRAALDGARQGDDRQRAATVSRLVRHLPPALLERALETAIAIANWPARRGVLAELSSRLVELPAVTLAPLWFRALKASAARSRPDLLADLQALGPVIAALGGAGAIDETVRAIYDTGRWWP
jgi:phosphoribosyl-ATP pyrophosphohydrolase